jgi:hypothetical protein
MRNDDFRPLVWRTTDYGQTWTSIAGNLPKEAINVIREDPANADLLWVGTELGLYGSMDAGKTWTKVTGSPMQAAGGRGGGGGAGGGEVHGVLPTTPIYDLKIHPRDHEIVLGTHGRGIWIADVSALEDLTPAVTASDAALLSVQPLIQWGAPRTEAPSSGFSGQSRPAGIAINYYLKTAPAGDVKVRIYDGSRMISEMDGPKNAGLNGVRWTLQAQREAGPAEAAVGRGGRGGGGGGGRGGAPAGAGAGATVPMTSYVVGPGEYRVVLSVGGHEYTQKAQVLPDPTVR